MNIKIWSRNAKDCSKNEAAVPFGFFMMYREGLFLKRKRRSLPLYLLNIRNFSSWVSLVLLDDIWEASGMFSLSSHTITDRVKQKRLFSKM